MSVVVVLVAIVVRVVVVAVVVAIVSWQLQRDLASLNVAAQSRLQKSAVQ